MNEEIDEFSVYHQDFTTASEWEVFVARLEEILHDWRLSRTRGDHPPILGTSNSWIEKTEELQFYGSTFTFSYHYLEIAEEISKDELISNVENKTLSEQLLSSLWEVSKSFMDKESESPFPVSSWYSLKQYVMLHPHTALTDESQIKLILSSINIALANVKCSVPIFVKLREHWQQCFRGVFEDNDCRTSFDTIHLKRIPSQCYHLTGLINLFKGKISSPVALEPVQMSAKFSYDLKDLETFRWRRPHNDEFFLDEEDFKKWIELPFGAIRNPLKSVYLDVVWPKFVEDAVIDSASYSDFDPLMAPVWSFSVEMEDNFMCLLTETIRKMINLLSNEDLIMDTLGLSRSLGLLNPLHKITEPPNTISKLVKAAMGPASMPSEFKGPIPDEQLMPLLYYIFPDAVDNSSYSYPENLEVEFKQPESGEARLCGYIKCGPEGGLVWRLSVVAARLLDVGGLPYLAHFWYELVQELQYRWEHRVLVPGVAGGAPCARTCLLHQKLQLLNCCVARAAAAADHSSDDEFFDCSEPEGEAGEEPPARPLGRLGRLPGATLRSGAPLYVPRTQDPAPKTEEQLEEDAELMLRLGSDARASELRARMMSASLLSDMEAFKAANPAAELCDFVRWYSPRDWLPDGGGALSERMRLAGNPWTEAWAAARAVPAARQRRLFDEEREAERALHYLRSRTVAAVADMLLPGAVRAAAARLRGAGAAAGGGGGEARGRRAWEAAARELADAERAVAREARAQEVLGCAAEAARPGRPLEAAARARLTAATGGALPAPARREFVLRARDAAAPQLLRARLAADLLVVAAFTERTVL